MSSKKSGASSVIDKRLPVFGPLQIKNVDEFLSKAKKRFDQMYNIPCPYIVELDQFEIFAVLGKGHFGTVFLVRDKALELFAMKALSKKRLVKKKQIDHALNEKRILQSIDFPFGTRMEYFSKDNSYIYFIMPFVPGGELYYHLKDHIKFEEEVSVFYAAQVVLGFEYLHYLDLVYRDLKPENLLIDQHGYLKITDFGFTKLVPNRTYTLCGTPAYFAPEAIKGKGYGQSVDWWALGILIYEINAGYEPFLSKSNTKMMMKILIGKYEMPSEFSPALKDLIQNFLTADVTKRIGMLKNGVQDIKNHPWFKSINWLALLNRKIEPPLKPKHATNLAANFPLQKYDKNKDLIIADEEEYEEEFKDF